MQKQIVRAAVFAVALVTGVTASAQITVVQPRLDSKGTAAGQYLVHNFIDSAGIVRGRFLYGGPHAAGERYMGFASTDSDYLGFFSTNTIRLLTVVSGVATEQARVTNTGMIIGTNPAATAIKLTINGAIDVKAGIAAQYQDVAEWVAAVGNPTPGTVMIVDENSSNSVTASETPYDTRVAGVVSPRPGLILGIPGEDKVMVATFGRVKVKVDATAAPIRIGDLLVTGEKPGVAMKSLPIDVAGIKMHRPGTVVGKALEPLASGTGEILVLLSLQ